MSKIKKIVSTISQKFNIQEEKILEEIRKKIEEFGGLVSEEGAAMLVARDYGIDVKEISKNKVSDLVSGIKNVALTLRIFKISDEKSFERQDGTYGKLKIVYAGDETGYTRILFWDKQIDLLNNLQLKIGDVITIYNPKVKENIFGYFDLFLTPNTKIEKDFDENLPSVEKLIENFSQKEYERTEIKNLSYGFYELIGIVLKVYKLRKFEVCSICKSKLKEGKCLIHGEGKKENELVLSFELDDFSGTIRVALFRENVERFLGIKKEEILNKSEDEIKKILKNQIGKIVGVKGKTKLNKILNRLELIADEIFVPNLESEISSLIEYYGKEH